MEVLQWANRAIQRTQPQPEKDAFMRSMLKSMPIFLLALAFVAVTLASPVLAKTQSEMAAECIQALETGDTETAAKLANQMSEWKHLFSHTTIKNAEQCLQTITGEHWGYFSTKGRFLSGDEARAEQAFILGADDRKVARKENLMRLNCEVTVARFNVHKLEAESKHIESARTLETTQATLNACIQKYKTDQGAALLSPICNGLFRSVGIPETKYEFDDAQLQMARLKLALSQLKLLKAKNRDAKVASAPSAQVQECKKLLAK